ncbi:MAG: hypothetical protein PWR27_1001 [Petroclostridium sp.]|nr:O-antigen ligase family protein [Clostridia bacterium]MDK2810292.1 hypothetical protein [Petroclostridium sp.]
MAEIEGGAVHIVLFSALLIVFSPYLAFVPTIFTTFRMLQKGDFILVTVWDIGLFFLFIWSLFVGVINTNEISAVASLAILFYFFLSVYLQNYYNNEEQIEKLLGNFLFVSIGSAFIGIIERYTTIHYEPAWWKHLFGIYPLVSFRESSRISGTFGNPNVAGIWYAVMTLICYYFYQNSSKPKKGFYVLGIGLFISVLMMTGSRGAIIGLILGLAVYAYFTGHEKRMVFLILLLISGVALMFIFPEWFPRGHNLFNSVKDRGAIWANCFNMFKYKPITGWGLMGIYFANDSVYHYLKTFHGHNIWITIATTMGIVGLGIFIYMKYYLFEQIKVLNQYHCRLTPLLAGIEVAVLGQGLLDFTIMNPQAGIIFISCSAIINGLAFQYSNRIIGQYFYIR